MKMLKCMSDSTSMNRIKIKIFVAVINSFNKSKMKRNRLRRFDHIHGRLINETVRVIGCSNYMYF